VGRYFITLTEDQEKLIESSRGDFSAPRNQQDFQHRVHDSLQELVKSHCEKLKGTMQQ
jgi:hypothetical protein